MNALRQVPPVHRINAIKEGMKIVRNILATHDSSNGFTTAELYQLALRQSAPPDFKGDPRLTRDIHIPSPPNNDHPVRSKSLLKRGILAALEGNKEIIKVVMKREITSPAAAMRGKKGKVPIRSTKESANASSSDPVLVKTWVWKPLSPDTPQPKPKPKSTPSEARGAAVGVGEDWSHLNKRRQKSREGKVKRDLATMKQLIRESRQARARNP